jgi:hypothetical protein
MKKLFFICLLLATTCLVFPQNKKGNLLIGTYLGSGGLSFSNSENGSSTSTNIGKQDSNGFSIGVGPSIGYFLTDNLVAGTYCSLSYSSSSNDNSNTAYESTSESSYHSLYFSVGPFVRYYIGKNNGKGMPYVHVNVGTSFYPDYSSSYSSSSGSEYTYRYKKYSTWNAGLQIGYEHFVNSVIGLQYYLGYSFSYYNTTSEYEYAAGTKYSYDSKSNNHGISFGVGLQIHLDWLNRNK